MFLSGRGGGVGFGVGGVAGSGSSSAADGIIGKAYPDTANAKQIKFVSCILVDRRLIR
jgi:hypothetical protein